MAGLVGPGASLLCTPTAGVGPLVSDRTDRARLLGDVRYGSLADISERIRDVRFTPESGHATGSIDVRKRRHDTRPIGPDPWWPIQLRIEFHAAVMASESEETSVITLFPGWSAQRLNYHRE